MRVIIYGAGAVGGMTAAYLARSGIDILLITRKGQSEIFNRLGLHLISRDGEFNINVMALDSPGEIKFEGSDFIFLAVKSQDTLPALKDLSRYCGNIPIFCLQNGISNEEIASGFFNQVYGAMVMITAYSVRTAEISDRAMVPGYFIIGRYPQGTDDTALTAVKILTGAGFMGFTTPEIMAYKWEKLLINLSNAPNAITGGWGRTVEKISLQAVREAEKILDAAGIKRVTLSEINKKWPETLRYPGTNEAFEVKSSTWQSLSRGNPVETDYINGEIVRLAEKHGLAAPINKSLCEIVNEMSGNNEKPGKYTAEELAKMLGIDLNSM